MGGPSSSNLPVPTTPPTTIAASRRSREPKKPVIFTLSESPEQPASPMGEYSRRPGRPAHDGAARPELRSPSPVHPPRLDAHASRTLAAAELAEREERVARLEALYKVGDQQAPRGRHVLSPSAALGKHISLSKSKGLLTPKKRVEFRSPFHQASLEVGGGSAHLEYQGRVPRALDKGKAPMDGGANGSSEEEDPDTSSEEEEEPNQDRRVAALERQVAQLEARLVEERLKGLERDDATDVLRRGLLSKLRRICKYIGVEHILDAPL